MISALQLVSISDFILAALCIFLSGILFGRIKSYWSSYAMLCYFFLFVGLGAFMGGIDHGFFEPIDKRYFPTTLTYLFLAGATFFLFRYTILTYFKGKVGQVLIVVSYLQLIIFIVTSFLYHNFLLVVANYSPILLLFFVLNLKYMKRSKAEWNFTLFCVIMILATLVQVLGIGISPMVNGDTLFHIIAFIGYFFLFQGIREKSDITL